MSERKSEIVIYQGADQGGLAARSEPVTTRNARRSSRPPAAPPSSPGRNSSRSVANAHTRKNYLHAVGPVDWRPVLPRHHPAIRHHHPPPLPRCSLPPPLRSRSRFELAIWTIRESLIS